MRSKAPLALMEQMVMLLVFALAAALCIQAFVKSDALSLESQDKSRALLAAQNTAEMIRHIGGDAEHALEEAAQALGGSCDREEGRLILVYDQDWKATEGDGAYHLSAYAVPDETPGLERVRIQVFSGDRSERKELFSLEVAWLEEV